MPDWKLSHAAMFGLTDAHVVSVVASHRLHAEAAKAIQAMQQAALVDGITLHIASGFRSFWQQLKIWNEKYQGQRPVLDSNECPIAIESLSAPNLVRAILRFSALPGLSRHHWGSDCDVWAPNLQTSPLQLTQHEFLQGTQKPLTRWLLHNAARFDFYLPYAEDRGGVAVEPWHISFRPIAAVIEQEVRNANFAELLAQTLGDCELAGSQVVLAQLPQLIQRYALRNG